MISNSILSRGTSYLVGSPTPDGQSSTTRSTVYFVSEYFVTAGQPAAKSDVDYLQTQIEQIREQVNTWLKRCGSETRVVTEDATLLLAPRLLSAPDYFASYERVFQTVMLYRAQVGHWREEEEDVPTEDQKNAAVLGLANLILAHVPAPSPMLLEDGTIGAYWRRGQCYASIDFEVDGEHSWAGTDGTEFHSGTWKVADGQLPPALVSEILSIGN